jgi:CIC family chloride channel protein
LPLSTNVEAAKAEAIDPREDDGRGLGTLALISVVAGALGGLIAGTFRLLLERGAALHEACFGWAHQHPFIGIPLVFGTAAAATALAAWMVRRIEPRAAGSGIPDVEAVVAGEVPPESANLVPVKFVGGLLALGAGLALGREGPSVEMSGVAARLLGTATRRNWRDLRALIAAGAGAGLATAFGAPLAGVVFVLEELVRRFEMRIAIAGLGASAGAMAVADQLLGSKPDFLVAQIDKVPWQQLGYFLLLGLVAGVVGIAYNKLILACLAFAERWQHVPVELRAVAVSVLVSACAWWWPQIIGGGDPLAQALLDGQYALPTVAAILGIRFFLGPISYAVNTPGGLFAPILVLGAGLGLLVGLPAREWFGDLAPPPVALAVVGMSAFFTAVVRSPLTGIVLVTEMTANSTLFLPMLTANLGAALLPSMMNNPPIYDSLRERATRLRNSRAAGTTQR